MMKKTIDYSPGLDVRMHEDNLFIAFPKTDYTDPPYFTFGVGPAQFHLRVEYARALGIAIRQAIDKYDMTRTLDAIGKIDALAAQAHRILEPLTPAVEPVADDDIPF